VPALSGTVAESFAATAARAPGHDFLCLLPETARRYDLEPGTWSYAAAAGEIARLERAYRAAGYGHGHRAGLLLENRPAFFFHWLALNRLGVSIVPLSPEWRSAELEYLIDNSEICLAVAPRERHDGLARAAAHARRALALSAPDLDPLAPAPGDAPRGSQVPGIDSECALLYTSGTTGKPKGCVLPNEYFLWAGTWYAGLDGLCRLQSGTERLITPLPLNHMNALACSSMAMVLTGGCIIQLDRFHPGSWWDDVRNSRATIVHYLGVMPSMLLTAPPGPGDREHCVRFGFGAGVSPRLHAPFEARFGFPLIEAWAMTETGTGAVIIANREPRKVGSACFGRPEAWIDYRIVDEAQREVPAGQPGELLVRHHGAAPAFGFFRGYLKDPEATAAAWAGGYFHTGDLVRADADGALHFVDRKKNVIRRSGENISAVEVEGVLLQHPGVQAVGVAAVPDEVRGDEVFACVVLRAGAPGGADLARELQAFALGRLAYYKAPGYVAFCGELPLTPTAKIQRARLKQLARELLDGTGRTDLREMKKRSPP